MINKAILVGRVGKDPEVRHLDNNLTVARFTLATNETRMKNGEKTEFTDWHNIVMWRQLAEIAEKYVRKGSLVYIEGKIRNRSWEDKDGVKRYTTEIDADTMRFIGSRSEGQSAGTPEQSTAPSMPPIPDAELDSVPDDLPF